MFGADALALNRELSQKFGEIVPEPVKSGPPPPPRFHTRKRGKPPSKFDLLRPGFNVDIIQKMLFERYKTLPAVKKFTAKELELEFDRILEIMNVFSSIIFDKGFVSRKGLETLEKMNEDDLENLKMRSGASSDSRLIDAAAYSHYWVLASMIKKQVSETEAISRICAVFEDVNELKALFPDYAPIFVEASALFLKRGIIKLSEEDRKKFAPTETGVLTGLYNWWYGQ